MIQFPFFNKAQYVNWYDEKNQANTANLKK